MLNTGFNIKIYLVIIELVADKVLLTMCSFLNNLFTVTGNNHWQIYVVKFWTHTPGHSNPFNFMQFLGRFWQKLCVHAPPPPRRIHAPHGGILDPPLNNNTVYSKNKIGNRNSHSILPNIVFQINSISISESEEFKETSIKLG